MTSREDCINWEINTQMCPCTNTECDHWGICCECVNNHWGNESYPQTACMRGTERPAETMSLPKSSTEKCKNYELNLKMCPCDYEPCTRRGTCCDCVRNHWGNPTYPATACMRGTPRPPETIGIR